MKEDFLHYAWQYRQIIQNNLQTTDGEEIEIIDCGKKNVHAGPDFFNAKIKIGNTLWAGNVEIHQCSSDWYLHHHHKDERYNSVILHVIEKADKKIYRSNGETIPQIEIKIPDFILENHKVLLSSERWIRCENLWNRLSPEFFRFHLSRLLNKRFERKATIILEQLNQNKNNWEETFYISLARNFGMNTNEFPFEMLARSLSVHYLGKHKNNLRQIEAMLFGQAGLLKEQQEPDPYLQELQKEYKFLSVKFNLSPIQPSLWKLSKMHPANFPHIRIAQFAALIHQSSKLFSQILNIKETEELRDLFYCKASDYWDTHYSFGKSSLKKEKKLGKRSIDILIINTVISFLFAYSIQKGMPEMQEYAYNLLEKINPEQNSIIEKWKEMGIIPQNAYESQALLELKKQYCDEKKCLQCSTGHQLLSSKLTER